MKKRHPLVSVVVVNYNGKNFLKDCFDALCASNYPKSRMEIIMVDNCSLDGSVEYIKKSYPKVKIIENDVNNYCRANNLGITRAKGKYVAFLNNDTRVDRNWLIELIKVIEKDEKIGVVGSKILYPDGRIQNAGHYELPNFYWGERGAFQESKEFNKTEEVVSLCGAAVLYRKKCFREAGLFDEDYVIYNEDVDMVLRLRQKGRVALFVPKSIVYHRFHGSGSHELSRFYIERNRLLFIAKFYPEKLSIGLIGNKYFTVENNLRHCGIIYSFLLDIVMKLLKHHEAGMIEDTLKELFSELKKISNFENEILKSKVEEANNQLNTLNIQLTQRKEELSSRVNQLLQAEQEKTGLHNHIHALNIQLTQRQEEVSSKLSQILQKEQEKADLNNQLNNHINALNIQLTQRQEEVSSKLSQILQKEQEKADLNFALKQKQDELSGIYNSEGFKYVLRPLWSALWNAKQIIKKVSFKITRLFLLTSIIALVPLFLLLIVFFLLEYLAWIISNLFTKQATRKRTLVPFERLRVSIVIPNFNGLEYLKTCLQSIFAAKGFKDNSENEIIVVDDGSIDGSAEYAKINFPNLKVVMNKKNMGFGYSCNRGVKEAKNGLIILLNNDVILTENFLYPLIRHFKDENIFAVYPKVYGWDKNTFMHGMNMGEIRDGYVWIWNESNLQNKEKVYQASPSVYAIGGMMMFRKNDFMWLNGFDEIYKPYCWEDIDICYRAWKRGLIVLYEPDSLVYHKGHGTIGNYRRYIEAKNEILFFWKNITDNNFLKQHLNFLPINIMRFGLGFVKGFIYALNRLPQVIARRFLERKYIRVLDKIIFDHCIGYYRDFTSNDFKCSHNSSVKNILYVSHFNGKMTGAETGMLNIIKYLDRKKYRPIVVCRSQGLFTEILKRMNIEVICLDFPVLSGALDNRYEFKEIYSFIRGTLRAVSGLKEIIKNKEIYLVHSNISIFFIGALAARLKSIPHVWHIKEILPPGHWRKLFSIFIPLFSDKIITVSHATAKIFDRKKCTVIYDGVDLRIFPESKIKTALPDNLNPKETLFTVGFIGSIISWKGVHIFLKAASEVVKTFPNARFVVAGDLGVNPHYSRHLQEFVQLANLESKVEFAGFQEDIPQFLSLLDIVVVPSRRPDPGPNVVIEAMAKAKVVVASATGGIPEILNDGETGFLFPSGDWKSLSKILLFLMRDGKLLKVIGANAQKYILERLDASDAAKRVQRIYDGLLGYDNRVFTATEYAGYGDKPELKANKRFAQGRWMTDKMLCMEYASFCAQAYAEKDKLRKKNILILTPELPYPLDRGGNIRIFNHIKMLSQKYNIYLLSFIHNENENQYIPMLQEFCEKVNTVIFPISNQRLQASYFSRWSLPKTIRSCYSAEFKLKLRDIIASEKIDLVQIDSIFMSFYVTCFSSNIPAILIEHDIDALSFRKSYLWSIRNAGLWYRFFELKRLSRFERYICKKYQKVVTLSERDKKKLEGLTGVLNAAVVPTGVDTNFFYPDIGKESEAVNDIIFVGYMGHYPNEDGVLYFYNHILPFIRREYPDIKLYVIGSHPTRRISELKADKNVVVTGFVEDIRPYFRKCAVFIVPLRLGGGIRGKILEAMAMGMPVISTSTGCNGIQVIPEEDIIVADGAREFARQTVRLLKDKNLRKRLAKNGRVLVENNYSWQKTIDKLDDIYADTIDKSNNNRLELIYEQR